MKYESAATYETRGENKPCHIVERSTTECDICKETDKICLSVESSGSADGGFILMRTCIDICESCIDKILSD